MLKQKNKSNYDSWIDERVDKGHTFKYIKGVLFGHSCNTSVQCVETGEQLTIEYTEPESKLKFAPELVKSVRLNMIKKDSWLKVRKNKKSDKECSNCKREYEHIDTDIALMFIPGQVNKHVCHDCGSKYISLGAEDIEKKINEAKAKKDDLIEKIRSLGNYRETGYYSTKFDDIEIAKLEIIYTEKKAEKEESDRIEAIVLPEIKTEEYLIKEYGVIENVKYLKCEEQIEDYFKDCGYDLFDCGQGYFQDKANVICKIGERFYDVLIIAEQGSAKQDRGDRLYWVESIEKVTWKEIDKPMPKEKLTFSYEFTINQDEKSALDSYLKERNFDHK